VDLLRSHTPQHTRDAHGEYIAARTVALHMACDEGGAAFTMRPVGRIRRWHWYAVTAELLHGADLPFTVEREGRAWTRRGARRAAQWFVDPTRPTQEALRASRYDDLGPRAARVVRALDALQGVANTLGAVGLVACLVALLTRWSGAYTLVNVVFFACAVPSTAARVVSTVLTHRARTHAEEVR
jgi:hypothetical protein